MRDKSLQKWLQGLLLLISGTVTMQSCVIVNATKIYDSNICPLHNIKMKKAIVKTQYGNAVPRNDLKYPNAKSKFPMGCVVPGWPAGRLAKIYHCNECDRIKNHSIN